LCGLSSKAHYMLLQACLTKNRKQTVVISQAYCLLYYAGSLFYLTVIEKSVFCQTTWHHFSEDKIFHSYC
jgi:hypothetical protein